jgi:hypothetical protein
MHLLEVSDQLHAPSALPPVKELLVPIVQEAGSPQSRSGLYREEKNFLPLPEIELLSSSP